MYKPITVFSFASFIFASASAQKLTAPVSLQQGDSVAVSVTVKQVVAQQAMGQPIDFHVDGVADHFYKVSNSTDDNITLHHKVQRMQFDFDGMGQKRSFDSNNKKDLDGQFGKPIKDILSKEYDMIIDRTGNTKLVRPEKIALQEPDARFALIANMMKDLILVIYPPQKNTASLFRILPEAGAAVGESWQETFKTETESGITTYTLSSVTDTTIIVDFKTIASSSTTSEMMGREVNTTMKSNITGQLIADKTSGLIKEKNSVIESNGAAELTGSGTPSMPINSKTNITMTVRRFQ
ncbi:MAG: hypothetical protein DI535_18850 [Citrobacter freundii]|nr:MAG: hypothetical protein DI535_18850 [Citrobacter freundii]